MDCGGPICQLATASHDFKKCFSDKLILCPNNILDMTQYVTYIYFVVNNEDTLSWSNISEAGIAKKPFLFVGKFLAIKNVSLKCHTRQMKVSTTDNNNVTCQHLV